MVNPRYNWRMKKLRPLHVLFQAQITDTDLKNWIRPRHLPLSGTPGRTRLFNRAEVLLIVVFAALGRAGMPLRMARHKAREIADRALAAVEPIEHAVFDPNAGVGRWFDLPSTATIADITSKVGPQKQGGGTLPAQQIIIINVGEMLRAIDHVIDTMGEEGAEAETKAVAPARKRLVGAAH